MSAAELRKAAETLRERADHANADDTPWVAEVGAVGTAWINTPTEHHAISMHGWPASARYIATMHPGVGLALAAWLDRIASTREKNRAWVVRCYGETHADAFMPDADPDALGIARLINGGQS